MSDFPSKPDASSPSLPTPPERRRGRVLLAATAASAAFTMVACGIGMTTNPGPCVYDGGLTDWDCDPSNGTDKFPIDAGTDAGTDAGVIPQP
ncbi:hypothetical protein D7X55_03555 [Corallococcus sp. AB049A]|uniref:Uncharacterized protein n=1 Tax=Corallococcus interemptor TaxID=2316720 RepID=A0A3A8QR08_9BACT|nr:MULTISPECIES: hypothetical protein [Corallococcus]RKH52363.1 hypothetical protein D7Y23_07295 [Corallococcus sp. AB050B]RKH70178.1 hypothetical protein D7X96_12645 [Corallococcus interemptor]RKI73997.1 hypothetical protein D7X55_03555 [Corallococcus sp. AB049A]